MVDNECPKDANAPEQSGMHEIHLNSTCLKTIASRDLFVDGALGCREFNDDVCLNRAIQAPITGGE